MQSTKHEMAGFRGRQRELNGLQIAHFADQDDVRILAQRRSQRVGERSRMGPEFSLVHQTFLGLMNELHRILNGKHVPLESIIQEIDHPGERRGFA